MNRARVDTERDLIRGALIRLAAVGVLVEQVAMDTGAGDTGAGARVRMTTPTGRTQVYEVRVKQRVSPAVAAQAPGAGRTLLVSPHVPESVAELLRQRDVHFVDSAGNIYLRLEGLLVDVRGRKGPPSARPAEPGRPLRAFKASGLRILFMMLADPDMARRNLREIAEALGMSLGTVQWVRKELEEHGYFDPAERALYRTGDLLDRWVEAYALELFPQLTLGRFEAADPRWWANAGKDLRAEGAQWGGETAAHFLHGRLLPGRAIVYASRIPDGLAGTYRFRKAWAGEGNVEIRERFWPAQTRELTVPTPLVYADLIASRDPRQLEAAAALREHDDLLRRLDGR